MDHRLVDQFRRAIGREAVLSDPVQLVTYECDALPHLRSLPELVLLPQSAADVQAIVRICDKEGIPFVARGHGTGLSGGALPVPGGVVISLAKLNRVLEVDIPNQRVTVEPGVTNLEITRCVAPSGYYYAPDPSSQQVCSLGGNVAENSGGAHCLSTASQCTTSLPSKPSCRTGARADREPTCRCARAGCVRSSRRQRRHAGHRDQGRRPRIRKPESVQTLLAAFNSISEAGAAVSDIIAAGIVPAAVEMMDAVAIEAAEAAVHPNFPSADTILIVELDGPSAEVSELFAVVESTPEVRCDARRDRAGRGAAGSHLERTKGGVCGDGPYLAELLCPGRCRAAHEAARSARGFVSSRNVRVFGLATCFMPGTATCIR